MNFYKIIGTIFILISNIFALYPAEFVRHAFDYIQNVLENPNSDNKIRFYLLKYGGFIILFAILKGIFMYFMRQTIIVMSRRIEFDLKNEIYTVYNENLIHYKNSNYFINSYEQNIFSLLNLSLYPPPPPPPEYPPDPPPPPAMDNHSVV